MLRLRLLSLLGLAFALGAIVASSARADPPVTTFSAGIPWGAQPVQIVAGSDGNLWFTETGSDQIGQITPAGVVRQFPIPTAGSRPEAITLGPDGNLWFTEPDRDSIARITTAGAVTEFPIHSHGMPLRIVAGPDGNLWFTEYYASWIGRITTSGDVREFPISSGYYAEGITSGPDGNLWFTEPTGDRVGLISPSGGMREFTLQAGRTPDGIAAGPDGNLWFTEYYGLRIGRITPSGVMSEFGIPSGGQPFLIAAGPDGNLWFTEYYANRIGRVTPTGTVSEFAGAAKCGTPSCDTPFGIVAGPDGNVWVTDTGGSQLERVSLRAMAVAATGPASEIGASAATLSASVDPGGLDTQVSFQYGPTPSYGSSTSAQDAGSREGQTMVSTQIHGLAPGTTYHYRVVATDGSGTAVGSDATFTTAAATPSRPVLPPVISDATLHPARLAAPGARRAMAVLRFSLDQPAVVELTIARLQAGRRVGRTCVPPSSRNRRHSHCLQATAVAGGLTLSEPEGITEIRFRGWLPRRPLPPGSYRLSLTPRNAYGLTGKPANRTYLILRSS